MGFFPDADQSDYSEYGRLPAEDAPAVDVVPGVFPTSIVLGRSPSGAVAVTAVRVYPQGLALLLEVRAAPVTGPLRDIDGSGAQADEPDKPGRLKWGIEFPTGERATNLHRRPTPPGRGPVLVARGGSSGERSAETEYWVSPLPGPGQLTFACEWLDRDISFTTYVMNTSCLRAAATAAITLW